MKYEIKVLGLPSATKIEKVIQKMLPELPMQAVWEAFAHRDVKIDGIRRPRGTPVQNGSVVEVYTPVSASNSVCVVYEDEFVLLVNKPQGISVHADEGFGVTLLDMAQAYLHTEQVFLCHRLDNQTGGLLLLAKDEASEGLIRKAFISRTVDKVYTALVKGPVLPPELEHRAFLVKNAMQGKVRIVSGKSPGAVPIVTGYRVLTDGEISRVSVNLITGRTHQIRAHMAYLGHPILGDDAYGNRAWNKQHKTKQLMLYATQLTMRVGGHLSHLDERVFMVDAPF